MLPSIDDTATLSQILPGRWTIKATNFPMWITGERRDPSFEYGLVRQQPLVLSDLVSYSDAAGKPKSIKGRDKWNGQGFVWRGGPLGVVSSRWQVAAAEQNVMTIRFEKSIATPEGVDVVLREGFDSASLRTAVAADPSRFGLTLEEFASLTWLDHLPPLDAPTG